MPRPAVRAGRDRDVLQAGRARTRSGTQGALGKAPARSLLRSSRARRRDARSRPGAARRCSGIGRRPAWTSLLPRVPGRDRVVDPGGPGPEHARARQMRELGRAPLAEREHVQRLAHRDDACARPRPAGRRGSRPARTSCVSPARHESPLPDEHVEDLLLGAVVVRGRRALAGLDADPAEPDVDRPGRAAEVLPERIDVAALDLVAAGRRVVRVREVLHGQA